jgi:hypothetical protein
MSITFREAVDADHSASPMNPFATPDHLDQITFFDPGALKRAVADTAAFLDEHVVGWHRKITRPIRMESVNECVLGQVFALPKRKWYGRRDDQYTCGYARGMNFLAERNWPEDRHSFVFTTREARPYWEAEIKRRHG